jgi:hypothetical protein
MGRIKKVKGATLIETIVAMVIILVVFVISSMVFVQIAQSSSPLNIKAKKMMEVYIEETTSSQIFTDEEISRGEFLFKRQIIENNGRNVKCNFAAYNKNHQLIGQQQRILLLQQQ